MREAAEKKKELEKQHSESLAELRTAQASLSLLAGSGRQGAEAERAQHAQNVETLQSRIRELERKMELQNVRHDELLLELAALRRTNNNNNNNSSGGGAGGVEGSGGGGAGRSSALAAIGSSQSFDLDSRGSTPGMHCRPSCFCPTIQAHPICVSWCRPLLSHCRAETKLLLLLSVLKREKRGRNRSRFFLLRDTMLSRMNHSSGLSFFFYLVRI